VVLALYINIIQTLERISADIHGICVEKGISLEDMEMMQFHPTVFVKSPFARKLLLTEALRGDRSSIL